jgi:MarC family membrane protein
VNAPDLRFGALALSSLFSVINPISAAPIFVTVTAGSPGRRHSVAVRACLASLVVLFVFAFAGGAIFTFFGITVPAFQIAGGILFALMSFREMQEGVKQVDAEAAAADPSVVPLGIPIIAGPGAITTVVVLVGQAQDAARRVALAGAITANILLTLVILLAAPAIVARIGATGQRIVSKLMGLITAVIGIQFIINGVTTVLTGILKTTRP